jgi:hypothetical protein
MVFEKRRARGLSFILPGFPQKDDKRRCFLGEE